MTFRLPENLRPFLFWLLLPFVIPQALWIRQHAPRFAGASGQTRGLVGRGASMRLIAIGDSIIAGVGASTLDKALVGQTALALSTRLSTAIEWTALGKSGLTARSVTETLVPDLPAHAADFIVLSVGVNDVTSLTTTASFERTLDRLLEKLERHSPDAIIAVAGIPPMGKFPLLPQPLRMLLGLRATSFDGVVRRVVARLPRAVHVPVELDPGPGQFSEDGYHPSPAGYREFGAAVADHLVSRRQVLDAGDGMAPPTA